MVIGLIVRYFGAQGAVGEVPRGKAGGGEDPDERSGPIRRASNPGRFGELPDSPTLTGSVSLASGNLHGVRFYGEGERLKREALGDKRLRYIWDFLCQP
jgi:hypothetical protein